MKQYRISKWLDKIKEVEVLKETEKCLFIKTDYRAEQKVLKNSSYDEYYVTRTAAKAALIDRLERKVLRLKQELESAKDALERIRKEAP